MLIVLMLYDFDRVEQRFSNNTLTLFVQNGQVKVESGPKVYM